MIERFTYGAPYKEWSVCRGGLWNKYVFGFWGHNADNSGI